MMLPPHLMILEVMSCTLHLLELKAIKMSSSYLLVGMTSGFSCHTLLMLASLCSLLYTGLSNTLILRMYQVDPILPKNFPIHYIEPPVLYTSRTTNDGKRWAHRFMNADHLYALLIMMINLDMMIYTGNGGLCLNVMMPRRLLFLA